MIAGVELFIGVCVNTATIGCRVVNDGTVEQVRLVLQLCAAAVFSGVAVTDGEAVPGGAYREVSRLVEHALGVLAVKDGGMGVKVALREFCLGACKTAIDIHAFHHGESVGGDPVTVIDTLGHPYFG